MRQIMSGLSRVLGISVSGIGNTLLFTPFLSALRQNLPSAKIDLLVWTSAMAEPLRGSDLISEILVMPRGKARWAFLGMLRRRRYEISVVAFPSNKPEFHLLSFLIGAKARVSHRYPGFYWRTLGFLETHTVPAVEGLHDVVQNARLLEALGFTPPDPLPPLVFSLSAEERIFATRWLEERHLQNARLVGIHPGAGGALADWQGSAKRWPLERFAALADALIEAERVTLLIFGGPEEEPLKERLRNLARHSERIVTVGESLRHTAALIERCRLMISNDSGLMHVATALNVPTLGIFGPTSPSRTAPWGRAHRVVEPEGEIPYRLRYPFRTTSSRIRVPPGVSCWDRLPVDRVLSAALEMLRASRDSTASLPLRYDQGRVPY